MGSCCHASRCQRLDHGSILIHYIAVFHRHFLCDNFQHVTWIGVNVDVHTCDVAAGSCNLAVI